MIAVLSGAANLFRQRPIVPATGISDARRYIHVKRGEYFNCRIDIIVGGPTDKRENQSDLRQHRLPLSRL
jgi:hypothetical protein